MTREYGIEIDFGDIQHRDTIIYMCPYTNKVHKVLVEHVNPEYCIGYDQNQMATKVIRGDRIWLVKELRIVESTYIFDPLKTISIYDAQEDEYIDNPVFLQYGNNSIVEAYFWESPTLAYHEMKKHLQPEDYVNFEFVMVQPRKAFN